MSEKKYFDADAAYDSKTLTEWYISSVDDNPPVWTDEHIYELLNDFYVIPKDTKPADVVPVVCAHWIEIPECWPSGLLKCSHCGVTGGYNNKKYCHYCGAKMDESEVKNNE